MGSKTRKHLSKPLTSRKLLARKLRLRQLAQITDVQEQSQEQNQNVGEVSSPLIPDSSTDELKIEGRRIVNFQYLFDQIISFKHCELFSCSSNYIKIVKETKKGFVSNFILQCAVCKVVHTISTDSDTDTLNTNAAAVSGIISVGCGYAQLIELSSSLNIPSLSVTLYKKMEENLRQHLQEACWETMIEAGKEEARLAIESGNVDQNNVPLITVVADGAWCKRSYRTNYNAQSGAACIIGQKTGKILYLGIRNKYCSACNMPTAKEHTCFRNWKGPSTAMETDIILEGFRCSMQMHGVKYSHLVGDGDSSVFKKLCVENPYGSFAVQKIECSNHLLRCYHSKLRDLALKRFSSRGLLVPVFLRNYLKNNIIRLRTAVEAAIKYRRNEKVSITDQISNLKSDIMNSINHVFGDHNKCAQYFCKGQRFCEQNLIENIKQCGLYNDIFTAANRLVFHASSLIKNMTNNSAESYNSVLAKFIGGKRINYAKRGNYQLRCNAAAISFNANGEYHNVVHKKITNKICRSITQKYIFKKKRDLYKQRVGCTRRTKKPNRNTVADPDEDYGLNNITNVSDIEIETHKKAFLNKLRKTHDEILIISDLTKGQASSHIWFEERRKRITASSFGKICKLRKTTDPRNTAISILKGFLGSVSTDHGNAYEPIARQEFAEFMKFEIMDCGFYIHETSFFLGATPDGLIGDDGLLEIKCPYNSRNLSPSEAILKKKITFATLDASDERKLILKRNHNYFYQIQGQIHITKRAYCYFVCWTPKGFLYEKILKEESFFNNNFKKLETFYNNYYLPEYLKLDIQSS